MTIGHQFMEQTKYMNLAPSGQKQGKLHPPLELPNDLHSKIIDLVPPEHLKSGSVDFLEIIETRASLRKYSKNPLNIAELSFLLWCTQGVKEVRSALTLRTVPSAGSRHAFETFIFANRIDGLSSGLYRYLALEHRLQEISIKPEWEQHFIEACLGQSFIKEGSATFIWTAVAERMTWRYGDRGYRYLHLDAGHVCQNLYLASEVIQCGACAIAAFDDDQLNQVLGIDGEKQFALYLACVGRKE